MIVVVYRMLIDKYTYYLRTVLVYVPNMANSLFTLYEAGLKVFLSPGPFDKRVASDLTSRPLPPYDLVIHGSEELSNPKHDEIPLKNKRVTRNLIKEAYTRKVGISNLLKSIKFIHSSY